MIKIHFDKTKTKHLLKLNEHWGTNYDFFYRSNNFHWEKNERANEEQIIIMNKVKKINNLKFVIEDTHLYWNINKGNYIDF